MATRRSPLVRRSLGAAVALPLLLSGCGALGMGDGDGGDGGSGASASGDVGTVVTAFYPLTWITEQVAGDGVEVVNLVEPGGEPHDLELSVAQTGEVADAGLVVYLSQFQPSVDAAVEQSAGDRSLDLASAVDLLTPAEEDEHDHADEGHSEDEHADEHGDEHADEGHSEDEHAEEGHSEDEHADEEGHDHGDEHDHGDLDPHFWLDPLRLADAGDAVAERLAEVDPDNAAAYEDNAAAVRAELEALDQEYVAGLASCERDVVVVNHDAFGYLDRYGLDFHSITGITPDAEPTPAVLAELQELIASDGITTVFAERLASSHDADALAADTGLEVKVLDPIEGLTDQTADEDYLSLMRSNLEALVEANGC
ncbi:metal ABC transporter substrate-binding protein [Nocardioides zeae]|uniref:Zinc transport system substrate-binding protein n=1 Tax=Nocardioides zeae TaxID=1457234 RepID=A0AAJ1X0T3_9ACTN|nr:metal ABC transporter substrate-binding protein [Nocardioides zeae]MDQ1103474.1 zinc transport system substrate-binding protein [Nocardioides zeae]